MRYRIGPCEIDLAAHILRRDGAEVHVEPQVFALLACLARAGGDLVSYDALMEEVWGGRIVSDATVAARISAARAALGDDGKRQAILRTVPRRGVQLRAALVAQEPRDGDKSPKAPPDAPSDAPSDAGLGADAAAPAPALSRQIIRYTTSRDGTGIAWAECGAGPPLLRGGHWMSHLEHDWTSPVWRPLLDHLSNGRRLIRYDPRGTGLSDRSLNGAGVRQLVDDLEAVADAAGLDRFPIYATSQSVPVALAFAARHPDRVSRMVLLNGLVRGSTARGDATATETMVGMSRSGWALPGSPFMRAVATVFMPLSTPEEVDSLVEMQAASAAPDIAAAIRRMIGEIDVSDVLSKVVCPALVMHFDGDQVQAPAQSKLMARRLQDAQFQSFASPNHVLVPSDPVWPACLAAIDAFLDRETEGSGPA